jgi:glycosyltransferase involved in cell wall biosynthesis
MRLVFLNQYYPPDAAPTGVMLRAVAEECARQGHEVTVICAAGGYAGGGGGTSNVEHRTSNVEHRSEDDCSGASVTVAGHVSSPQINNRQSTIDNRQSPSPSPQLSPNDDSSASTLTERRYMAGSPPTVLRIPATRFGRGTFVGKLLDYASYYVGVAWRLGTLDPPPDRIVALTTPPYLSVLARAFSRFRGADHAHWVMDLYPDVMVAHGMLAEGGWKHRLLAGLARWGFGGRRCAAVLTLGPDMAARIEHRTSNIEHRREESCCGAPMTAVSSPDSENQKSAINNHQSSISSPDSENQQSTIISHQSSISSPDSQPSIFNSQLSPSDSTLRGMNESRDESRGPCLPTTDHRRPITVSWVPLWGEGGDIEHRTSDVERRRGGEEGGNIEHRTSDVERRRGEEEGGNIEHRTSDIERRRGEEERGNIEHRTSDVERRRGEAEGGRGGGGDDAAGRSEHGLRRDAVATGLRAARGWGDDELVVMYSGNMGLGHRFQEILEAVGARTSDVEHRTSNVEGRGGTERGIDSASSKVSQFYSNNQPSALNSQLLQKQRFVFYGGGKRRGEIEAFMAAHPEAPVELHDYAPAEELSAHLMSADVHLVSLEPAWTGTMVPSKLQGIFAVGRPVVFVGSPESSIGRWVEESGGGWVVAPGDVEGLRAALDEARDPEVRRNRGEAAASFARENFNRETNARRVVEVLVGRGPGRVGPSG